MSGAAADGHGSLETRAEILKLARLLRREPDTLAYLEQVSASELRTLREQLTEVLFNANSKTLTRLATASKLLPVGVVATITEKAFGPVLAARIAGLLDPGRAVDVAAKLPPEFLADIAVELDPRRARNVIAAIPTHQSRAVTRELVRREEYVTMGRFVGYLPDASLRDSLEVIDDAALLRIAFVLEHKERIDNLLELLGPERVEGLIEVAASEELWVEVVDLLSRLPKRRRDELIELGRQRHPELHPRLVAALDQKGLS